MSLQASTGRPLVCLTSTIRCVRSHRQQVRFVSAGLLRWRAPPPEPPRDNPWAPIPRKKPVKLHIPKQLPPIKKICAEPLITFNSSQLALLDPSGARTRLFDKQNEDGAHLGDVLLVRFKNGDPFCGVLMSIRRRGPDTGILLRNTVNRVGTEMWVKIYNPTVVGIEIVQRAERRARRAKLHYLRKPKHDRGDLSNVLNEYLKTRRTLGARTKNKKQQMAAERQAKERAQAARIPNQPGRSKGNGPRS